jgi:hypothetical protein
MIILLSGEGKSDFGQCEQACYPCTRASGFFIGSMTVLVDKIIESSLMYSCLEITPEQYLLLPKAELEAQTKAMDKPKMRIARGAKKAVESGEFFDNAVTLAHAAKEIASTQGQPVVAILFRDSDGTHSTPNQQWQVKWDSMMNGFQMAEYDYGVPMIPKPKSEAWLLCLHQQHQNCEKLESISGNDASPHSAKNRLEVAMNGDASAENVSYWLQEQCVDMNKLCTLPSFNAFYQRINHVIDQVLSSQKD